MTFCSVSAAEDRNQFIFQEQENQIESDRRQISRLNKKIDELGKASLEDKEENLRLRANIAELQDELKHKTNAIQQLNSRIQRTNSNPVRPIQTLQNSFNSTTLEGKRDLLSLLIALFLCGKVLRRSDFD